VIRKLASAKMQESLAPKGAGGATTLLICYLDKGATESMRLMLILLIVVVAFWAVQGQRHHCKFGLNASYVHCLLGREAVTSRPASETPATD
jgi:hypothetical protein